MQKHITAVGALRIGYGILGLLITMLVLIFTVGMGFLARSLEGDEEALAVLTVIGVPLAFVVALLSIADIIGGVGVLKHKNWARYLVMVHSVLDLFNFPIGSVLGIYSIWVLMQDETAALFTKGA